MFAFLADAGPDLRLPRSSSTPGPLSTDLPADLAAGRWRRKPRSMTSGRLALLAGAIVVTILVSPLTPSSATSGTHRRLGDERSLVDHSPGHASRTAVSPARGRTGAVGPPRLQPGTAGFGWPLDPPITVLRRFDLPPEPWLAGHRGVDLAARPGQAVRAAGSGVVTFAGPIAGRSGLVIRLTATPSGHAADVPAAMAGLRITYEPVRPGVHPGDGVRTGQVVGRLQRIRHCGVLGSCLHWGLRRGDTYLDPLLLVRPLRIRLLSLDGDLAPDPWPSQGPWWTRARERMGPPEGTWPAALALSVVSGLSNLTRAIVVAGSSATMSPAPATRKRAAPDQPMPRSGGNPQASLS
jgi:hypothetical protein